MNMNEDKDKQILRLEAALKRIIGIVNARSRGGLLAGMVKNEAQKALKGE